MFSTQQSFDSYLAEIEDVKIPAMCERVLFAWPGKDAEHHRVTGWYCAVPDIPPENLDEDLMETMFWELGESDRKERESKQEVRVKPCRQEEATHVSIYSIAGAVVRIDRVQPTGELCWSEERRKEAVESWNNFYIPLPASLHTVKAR